MQQNKWRSLRPDGLLYYSLCHNSNTFRAWSSLFRNHTPRKVLMNEHNASILWTWTSFFHEHASACFRNFDYLKRKTCMRSPPLYLLITNTVNGRQLTCLIITQHRFWQPPVYSNLPFINIGDFCQPPRLLHPPRFLFCPKFASLPVYSALPLYLFVFCQILYRIFTPNLIEIKKRETEFSRTVHYWYYYWFYLKSICP